jgi:hypothetical protein
MEFGNLRWKFNVEYVGIGAIDIGFSWVVVLHLEELICIELALTDSSIVRCIFEENGDVSSSFGDEHEIRVSDMEARVGQWI